MTGKDLKRYLDSMSDEELEKGIVLFDKRCNCGFSRTMCANNPRDIETVSISEYGNIILIGKKISQ